MRSYWNSTHLVYRVPVLQIGLFITKKSPERQNNYIPQLQNPIKKSHLQNTFPKHITFNNLNYQKSILDKHHQSNYRINTIL